MTEPNDTGPALQAEHLGKVYDEGPARIEVLSDVSLSVARGEMVAIVGASGSGKSTLLHIALDRYSLATGRPITIPLLRAMLADPHSQAT